MADTSNNPNSSERKRLEMVVVPTIDELPNPDHEALREQVGAFLYVIEFDDAVKIGVSQNPYRRAINLRTGSGRYANRAAYAGPYRHVTRAEQELLSMFTIQRVANSEWVNAPFEDVLDEARLIDAPIPTEEDLLKAASREEASERLWNEFRSWFKPDLDEVRRDQCEALRQELRLILPMFYILTQDAAKVRVEGMQDHARIDGLSREFVRGVKRYSSAEWAERVMEVLKSEELEFWAEDLAKFYFKAITKILPSENPA